MRYIDADALIKKIFPYDVVDKKDYTINAKAVADAIANTPTADVVPKSEDDWNSIPVDVSEALKQRAVEKAKSDVAREIFEEIDRLFDKHWFHHIMRLYDEIAELKKKYIGETE